MASTASSDRRDRNRSRRDQRASPAPTATESNAHVSPNLPKSPSRASAMSAAAVAPASVVVELEYGRRVTIGGNTVGSTIGNVSGTTSGISASVTGSSTVAIQGIAGVTGGNATGDYGINASSAGITSVTIGANGGSATGMIGNVVGRHRDQCEHIRWAPSRLPASAMSPVRRVPASLVNIGLGSAISPIGGLSTPTTAMRQRSREQTDGIDAERSPAAP